MIFPLQSPYLDQVSCRFMESSLFFYIPHPTIVICINSSSLFDKYKTISSSRSRYSIDQIAKQYNLIFLKPHTNRLNGDYIITQL